jgi:hypothetical protein
MACVCNRSTWEAEAGGWQVRSQPGLNSKTLCQKKYEKLFSWIPNFFFLEKWENLDSVALVGFLRKEEVIGTSFYF